MLKLLAPQVRWPAQDWFMDQIVPFALGLGPGAQCCHLPSPHTWCCLDMAGSGPGARCQPCTPGAGTWSSTQSLGLSTGLQFWPWGSSATVSHQQISRSLGRLACQITQHQGPNLDHGLGVEQPWSTPYLWWKVSSLDLIKMWSTAFKPDYLGVFISDILGRSPL